MHTHWTHRPRHMGHLHRDLSMIDHPPCKMAMCGFLSPPGLNSSAMHQIFHLPVSKSLPFLGVYIPLGFPDGASGKEPACQCRRHKRPGFYSQVGKIRWRRAWQPTPVFLPGESHGQRTLVSYSPWGRKVGHDWRKTWHAHISEYVQNSGPVLCTRWLHLLPISKTLALTEFL